MAKATRKKPAKKSAPKKKARARGRGKSAKPKGHFTLLAVAMIGLTAIWIIGAGSFAMIDVFDRRAACQNWLVEAGRGETGYRRVYDEVATKYGCSLTKIGFKGFIAEKPIYPNGKWILIVLAFPTIMMSIYGLILWLKRSWILGRKKRIWAKAGPLDFDDFEDMREFPEDEAEEKAKAKAAASPAPAADASAKEGAAKEGAAKEGAAEDGSATESEPSDKSAEEPEKEEEELSELEKIMRQVDG